MLTIIRNYFSGYEVIYGICSAERLDDSRYESFTPFVNGNLEKRVNPSAILPEARSVIVTGFPHTVPVYGDEPGATLSSLGVNEDYHKKMKAALHGLAAAMKEKTDFKYKVLVDSGTLDERALAVRAGLGFFGRNGTVISKMFGSFFNIGCLLTDLPTEIFAENISDGASSDETSGCPSGCRICADACPGGAISGEGLDSSRCVSYLTQKEGELTDEEKKIVGRQLYGCDVCREVCPFNKNMPRTTAERINPEEWLALSDDALTEKYSHTAMAWRKAEILKRNAKIIWRTL